MGLSSYFAGDYTTAEKCFKELAQAAPLNEVFNNLGATENRLNQPSALADLRRALEGDDSDPTYHFNIGLVLYRQGNYDEAAKQFKTVLDHNGEDREARTMLTRSEQRTPPAAGSNVKASGVERMKDNFDLTAFRQLKAMLQTAKP